MREICENCEDWDRKDQTSKAKICLHSDATTGRLTYLRTEPDSQCPFFHFTPKIIKE